MARLTRLEHSAKRKRRLFSGRLQAAYRREERLRLLQEGKKPRRRKLAAGKVGAAIRREERMARLAEGRVPERNLYSHRLKGEFGGMVRDPRVRRK